MKLLKYFLLALILLNITSFSLTVLGSGAGSLFSALLYGCVILYYFLNPKPKVQIIFIVLGLCYFLISGLNYSGPIRDFFVDGIKYFIFIIGAVSLARETNRKEIGWFMFFGAMTVLINAVVFSNAYGRYGGFYINPNRAGVACLIAFSLTFYLQKTYLKLLLQLLIVTAGIMTLSRTFIVVLLTINVIAIIANKRNSISLLAGSIALVLVLTVSSLFNLNTVRFSAFQSIFGSQEMETKTITKGSRNETWALYTDIILNNAVTGIGYHALHGKQSNVNIKSGVHNTFLMAIGESGIITFLLFIILYLALFFRSLKHIKTNPEYTCIATVLISFLLVSHNYFDNYLILFISIWLYDRVKDKTEFEISQIPVNL